MNAVVGGASQRQGRVSAMLTSITITSAVVTCRRNRRPPTLLELFTMTHTILLGDSVSARILTAELSGRAGAPVGAQADPTAASG